MRRRRCSGLPTIAKLEVALGWEWACIFVFSNESGGDLKGVRAGKLT